MNILKQIAQKRLVVMVTHNPELAEAYSTRIIRMLDGQLLSDTAPLTQQELEEHRASDAERLSQGKKEKKPAMKWSTSFGLSLKNLVAKRGRTTLTSFAGSIGIIGIALIYAVSQGMTTYINTVQEDTLSSYPLTIEASTMDLGGLMSAFLESAASAEQHENDAVYSKGMVYDLVNALNNTKTTENDLMAFKEHLEKELDRPEGSLKAAVSGIQYTYDLDLLVYTKNIDGSIIESDAQELMRELMSKHMGVDMSAMMNVGGSSPMASMMSMSTPGFRVWQEMLSGDNGKPISPLLEKQYDVIYGTWPTEYNEIVLVVDENNELDDMTLYALGLTSAEDMDALMDAAVNGTAVEAKNNRWTYEELCDMEFHVILPGDCYTLDESTGLYTDIRESDAGLRYLYDNGTVLKVTGIIRPNEESVSRMLSGSIGYTAALTEHVIEKAKASPAVKVQLANPQIDVITGLPFHSNTGSMTAEEKENEFRDHIAGLEEAALADAYIAIMSIPDEETLDAMVEQTMAPMTVEQMRTTLVEALTAQTGMNADEISDYVMEMEEGEVLEIFTEMVTEQVKQQYAAQTEAQLAAMSDSQLAMALTGAMESYTTEQCAQYYDEVLKFSEATYEDNLVTLGCLDLDDPASVNIYASTFENKDVIEDAITAYNEGVDELQQITYTDYVGLMMSSVTTIINAITYVLIAFVAISLVVSSIMIGVITLISVQERTKEIGILRAIGASKRNVSNMFNAETIMIGAASGGIGVGVTYLLIIPINAVINSLTGIANLDAYLPWQTALILVGISIFLSVFAGFIPARSAAKKDPVVALRTE